MYSKCTNWEYKFAVLVHDAFTFHIHCANSNVQHMWPTYKTQNIAKHKVKYLLW